MSARRLLVALAPGVLSTLMLGACASNPRDGYSFNSTYRDDIKSVSVPIFENTTFSYGLENELTEAVVSEIKRSTPWRVTDPEASQTTLTGKITSTELKQLTTARETGLSETLALVVTVDFEWKDNHTGRTLVARRHFQSSETFVPAGGYRERLAVGENATVQRLARDIVTELRASW